MSVQRFNMVAKNHGEHFYCTMMQDANGAYVLNSDYDELRARCGNIGQELLDIRINVLNDKVLRAAFEEAAKQKFKDDQTEKIKCQTECLNAFDKKLREAEAEIEHLKSENLLVREEADRYCRLWQEAKEGKQS